MQIRKIDTNQPGDVRQFVNFPFELYRECPQWVPPIVSDMKSALDRENYPFYRHSEADFFVAEYDGQMLGQWWKRRCTSPCLQTSQAAKVFGGGCRQ